MAFTARFPGTCRSCGGRVEPGEVVRPSSDGGYQHSTCPADLEAERDARRPVCPECFMLKPCECDDA